MISGTLVLLGAGKMGGALLEGWLRSGVDPARIVAPGRRGFWWVKWVAEIRPSARPAWAQSIFPLT